MTLESTHLKGSVEAAEYGKTRRLAQVIMTLKLPNFK